MYAFELHHAKSVADAAADFAWCSSNAYMCVP